MRRIRGMTERHSLITRVTDDVSRTEFEHADSIPSNTEAETLLIATSWSLPDLRAGIHTAFGNVRRLITAVSFLLIACFSCGVCSANDDITVDGVSDSSKPLPAIRFTTDVVPILTRLSCNSGGCHGKATGQNGFRLSLLGFEPDFDYEAIVHESRGRRLFPAAPELSLLLRKATAELPHGGGKRLQVDSEDYRILRQWIAAGTPAPSVSDPTVTRIEISPGDQIMDSKAELTLTVTAFFSDGTSRNVTRQASFESNEPEIAEVSPEGHVTRTSRRGLAAVMARFGEQIDQIQITVPFSVSTVDAEALSVKLSELKKSLSRSPMDEFLFAQWSRMQVLPSSFATDAEFVRRASIDVCGTLPTQEEVERFVADSDPNKHATLISELLKRPEHASYFALKWADILQNRGAGYATSQQRAGTTLFAGWIRDSIASNKPYDQFVEEILTATGAQSENPATLWYRTVRKPQEYVESVAQAFLGMRIQCAQCHHHPAERWSQADYYRLAAVFSRVARKGGFADAEVPTDEIIFIKKTAETRHPRTGEILQPAPPGGTAFAINEQEDPRVHFTKWMTSPENPYFARTIVNRMWAHFMGRGLVHPIDDARSTNPPVNPELLNALAADFVSSGFDMHHLIRTITATFSYRLSSSPSENNSEDTQTFARFYPRRMTAEVLLDGFSQILNVPTEFPGGQGSFPLGTRAIDLPDENVAAGFLDVFGRPGRMTACECERVDAPALPQALELVNSTEIHRKLTHPEGYASELAKSSLSSSEIADQVFLRILCRAPDERERQVTIEFLDSQKDRAEACRSLLWSLLATNEFLFNH